MDARCVVKHNVYKVTNINVKWSVKKIVNQNAKDNETKMHLHIQKDDRHILNIKVVEIIAK